MGQYVPPLSIKTDPRVRVTATPPAEAGRVTRVICQEINMISGYHADKLEIEFDIGALIDGAVRSGFDDEDEPESTIEPYTAQHGSVEVEIESIKKDSEYRIDIDYDPGLQKKPVTIFLNGEIIHHGVGHVEIDETTAGVEAKFARLREVIEQKKRERGENPEDEPTK